MPRAPDIEVTWRRTTGQEMATVLEEGGYARYLDAIGYPPRTELVWSGWATEDERCVGIVARTGFTRADRHRPWKAYALYVPRRRQEYGTRWKGEWLDGGPQVRYELAHDPGWQKFSRKHRAQAWCARRYVEWAVTDTLARLDPEVED